MQNIWVNLFNKRITAMILVTRFDGTTLYINPELIRSIEHTPDTVITLTTDYKILVKNSADEIRDLFIEYQKMVRGDALLQFLKSEHKED